MGNVIALLGAAIVVIMTGAAASIGMQWVQRAAAGVISEEPEKFGKLLILQLVPSSSALYGFVVGFMVLMGTVLGGGDVLSVEYGLLVLAACLPMAIVGFVQTLAQAKVCVSCVHMVAKNGELSGKALTMAIFTELFALFALIVSIMTVMTVVM